MTTPTAAAPITAVTSSVTTALSGAVTPPGEESGPLLALEQASIEYRAGSEIVSDVSLALHRAEILGLVGESGCGKSTTARAMLGLLPLRRGRLLLHGRPVTGHSSDLRSHVQAIFQNPAGSFNPKRSLLESVAEPLRVHHRGTAKQRRNAALAELDRVGISAKIAMRRPGEVSGGQCQRAAIARATVLRPEVLICDEPVSALDVSIQAQILELLVELRREIGLAMLFISHDLSVVASLCDRTAVMFAGKIVESGTAGDVALQPRHPYSVILHDAVPTIDLQQETSPRLQIVDAGEDVDPRTLPGCRFAALCPLVQPDCLIQPPPLAELTPAHRVACLHPVDPLEPQPSNAITESTGLLQQHP